MNTIIGTIGPYTIFTVPNPTIQPGHQYIAINDASLDAAYILCVLTGAEPHSRQEVSIVGGILCRLAPHDDRADRRLLDVWDLITHLRLSTPELVQLQIEGLDNERST